jgi:hypothetical protein
MPLRTTEERPRVKQPRAKVEVPKPVTKAKVQVTQKQAPRTKERRLTVYENFQEDCFGKRLRLSPKPFERRKSLLSVELKHEKDVGAAQVARMKTFRFPGNKISKDKTKYVRARRS